MKEMRLLKHIGTNAYLKKSKRYPEITALKGDNSILQHFKEVAIKKFAESKRLIRQ